MKCWTILALLITVCAVFLGVGHTEETEDDFREQALENVYSDTENDGQLENALDSVNENPSNDEDEPAMFKRAPWGRRRRRRRFWRRRHRFWRHARSLIRKIHNGLKRVCGWLKDSKHRLIKWSCHWIKKLGDEEFPRSLSNDEAFISPEARSLSNDEAFISPEEAEELMKQGWKKEE